MSRIGPDSSAQNFTNNQTSKITLSHHLFADNMRFLSMAAIVGMHTIYAYGAKLDASLFPELLYLPIQFLKFGTIAFSLVAGFLFGDRMTI